MVLIAIYRAHSLRTITNCFIASLALADLLVGIIVAPLAALSFVGLPHNFLGCVFVNSLVVLFTQISVFSLLAIAMERFIAIVSPFFYQNHVTFQKAILILVLIWIFGILIGLVPMFGWNLGPPENMVCAFTTVIDMSYMVYFVFIAFVLIPLTIMFCIYLFIFITARKQIIKIAALDITDDGRNRKKMFFKEIRAAKSLALVLGLFAVCWLPIHVSNAVGYICGSGCRIPVKFVIVAVVISHANSMINPVLYAHGNSQFRSEFRKMFCLWKVDNNHFTWHRSAINANRNILRTEGYTQHERF